MRPAPDQARAGLINLARLCFDRVMTHHSQGLHGPSEDGGG
jgi:hypothetical protein